MATISITDKVVALHCLTHRSATHDHIPTHALCGNIALAFPAKHEPGAMRLILAGQCKIWQNCHSFNNTGSGVQNCEVAADVVPMRVDPLVLNHRSNLLKFYTHAEATMGPILSVDHAARAEER